jgi:hypothetical protein
MMVATIILMLWRNWSPLPMIVTGGFVGIATKNTALLSPLWR